MFYFKYIFCCLPFLLFSYEVLSQPVCNTPDEEVSPSYLKDIKKRFHAKMNDHYSRLVKSGALFEERKNYFLEKYKNSPIKVYSNPSNKSQKIVYIEYEKNWSGMLYFAIFIDKKASTWIKIETYGAITTCVRWKDEKSFFYADSTHMCTRTQTTCLIQNNSVHCEEKEPGK